MEHGPRMTTTADRKGLLMSYRRSLYSFSCQSMSRCSWDTSKIELKISREFHVMMRVPASLVQNCECQDGYYGNTCEKCHCNIETTVEGTICHKETGQCDCKQGFYGQNCDETCKCNVRTIEEGTVCQKETGQCKCKDGYYGLTCDESKSLQLNCLSNRS